MKRTVQILIVLIFVQFLSASTPVEFSFRQLMVVYREPACSYFIAEGGDGYFRIFEWRDGYDPQPGAMMLGKLQSAGYADIYYPLADRKGAVRLVSSHESWARAVQSYFNYCGY